MHRHIIIGPPGTGKTTYLKDKVQEFLKADLCSPKEIGYFSFTVRAAEEIRDRIVKDSNKQYTKETIKIMYPYFSKT
jgi:superfamily I DNA/RNA helicase